MRTISTHLIKSIALAFIFIGANLYGQNVTINSTQLTTGLASTTLIGGSSNLAVFGIQLDKDNVAANTVTGLTVTLNQDPTVRFTSAKLYLSTDNSFGGVGSETLVSTGSIGTGPNTFIFTGSPITNFGGAGAAAASSYLFVVVDVDATVTGATTAITPSLAVAGITLGTVATVSGSLTGTAYSFSALTATATANNGGSPASIMGTSTNQVLFGFSAKTNGTQSVNNIVFTVTLPSSVPNLSSLLTNIKLKEDGSNTTYSGTGTDLGSVSVSAGPSSTYTITLTPSVALSGSDKYFYLVADVPAAAASTTGIQIALTTLDVTQGASPSITGFSRSFDITALIATLATNNTGAPASILAGATNQILFGFSAKTNGTQSINNVVFTITLPSSVPSLSNLLTTIKLKDDGTNSTYTGSGTDLGSMVVSAGPSATYTLTLTPSVALSGSDKYFYLVADVPGAATTTSGIQIAPTTLGVTQGTTTSIATFSRTFGIGALSATVNPIAAGTAPVPAGSSLSAGTTAQVLTGFSITSNGSQVLSSINFNISSTSSLSNVSLYRSTSAGSVGSSITTNAAGNFDLTAVSAGNKTINSTAVYYYLVADISNSVTSATAGITVTPNQSNIVAGSGSVSSFSINRSYTFNSSQLSDIDYTGGSTSAIAYKDFQTSSGLNNGNSVSLGDLRLRDGGGSSDPDNLSTTLTSLTVSISNFANLRTLALFDGGTNLSEQTAGASVTFPSLSLSASDNNTNTFTLRATFNSTVTDNQFIQISVTGAATSSSGSGFAISTAGAATTGGATNKIDVVATKLVFVANPPTTPINTNFNLTVKAVDHPLNNLDTDVNSQVTLSKSGGNGSAVLSSTPQTLNPNLASGQFTWTSLKLNLSGTYTLTGAHSTLTDASGSITISSNGVVVTAGSVLLTPMCYNGAFQTLSNITIAEGDPADFGNGSNQILSLVLPAGFIFDINQNPTPSLNNATGSEISSPVAASYVGNSIVKIGYSITGTSHLNSIVISGLKVKYTGSTPITGNILRYGGTAIQAGNSETDLKNHGTLQAAPSGTLVDFTVQELAGQPAQIPTETRFSINTNAVKLIGSPTGGVFTGNGVIFTPTNGYTFNPGSIGVGTNYDVVYTYTEPSGQQCQVTKTKTFEVYASVIGGLDTKYCTSGTTDIIPDIPQSQIDTRYGGSGVYLFHDFVYYNADVSSYIPLPKNGSNQYIFDPTSSIYTSTTNIYGGVYVYYRVHHNSTPTSPIYGQLQFVTMLVAPTVTLVLPKTEFCADETPITLVGSPSYSSTTANDFFTATNLQQGAFTSGGSPFAWTFTPASVSNVAPGASQSFDLTYTYRDPYTQCSNTSAPSTITVHARPTIIPVSDIVSGTSLSTCKDGITVNFTTNNTTWATTKYNWYSSSMTPLSTNARTFSPSVPAQWNTSTTGNTNFYVTRTINGCESIGSPLILNATVDAPAVVNAGGDFTICQGSEVVFSALTPVPSITGAVTNGVWSTIGASPGTFRDASNNINNSFTNATRYIPSANDIAAGSVRLILTSDDPTGPCNAVIDEVIITINKVATPNAGADVTVCSGQAINLNGNITGGVTTGTWTRNGQGTFGDLNTTTTTDPLTYYTPSTTELASGATITFTLTTDDPDASGPCNAQLDVVDITINRRALVDAGPNQDVCDGTTITLAGLIPTSPPSSATSFTWSGGSNSFSNPVAGNATYNPLPSEVGTTVVLTLTSNDPDGTGLTGPCTPETDQVSITIKSIPSAPTATSPPPYCVGNAIVPLIAAPANGNATLNWYKVFPFIPANSLSTQASFPTGEVSDVDKIITYYVTQTILGCQSPETIVKITVNPLPNPIFTAANLCLGDNTKFTDASTLTYTNSLTGTIDKWQWDFDDGYILTSGSGTVDPSTHNGTTGGTYNIPTHKYNSTKEYNVRLTVTTSDLCTNSITSLGLGGPTRIGPVPIADFSIESICDQDNTQFKYTGTGPGGNVPLVISTYAWTFGDPSSASNTSPAQNPTHQFTGVNTYPVSVTVTTDLDCQNMISKSTFILPYIKSFPYQESFETTGHGWVTEGLNTNALTSWKIISPAGTVINAAEDGAKAWITSNALNTYDDNERSVVYGPCFDMTQLQRPVLNMQYWNNTDPGNDGAYMEYSIDNGITWKPLGDVGKGLEWYNRSAILGLSQQNGAGQSVGQIGWSGANAGWASGKYNLDDWKTQNKFRVRLLFGSNGDNPSGLDGFALDNFKIETRNRIILTENFTSASAAGSSANNQNFDNFFLNKPAELVKLQYHIGIPEADAINKQNPADLNARAAFYGLTNSSSLVPRIFLDGTSNDPGNFVSSSTWADNYYQSRSLVTSPFDIAVSTLPTDNDKLAVSVKLKATSAITKGKPSLFIAVIEKTVGNEEFIVRKLLPSPTGIQLTLPIALNQEVTVTPDPWEVKNVNTISELAIVAFVQDAETREILQAAYLANPGNLPSVTTGVEPSLFTAISAYPNPTDHELTIQLPATAKQSMSVQLSDQLGKIVHHSTIKAGDQTKVIPTHELAEGLYILQVEIDGRKVRTKVIVVHPE